MKILPLCILMIIVSEGALALHDTIPNIALSAQISLFDHLETISNNVANANTPGFKGKYHIKTAYQNHNNKVFYQNDIANYNDFSVGQLEYTQNKLDLAISGKGFFLVETPKGKKLTRSGNLRLNNLNQLVTTQGYKVLDEWRNEIVIDNVSDLVINAHGDVINAGDLITTIGIFKTNKDIQKLTNADSNLFNVDEKDLAFQEEDFEILQGYLEKSTVISVKEMANLINVQNHSALIANIANTYEDVSRSSYNKILKGY